jgi:hypothetical protein
MAGVPPGSIRENHRPPGGEEDSDMKLSDLFLPKIARSDPQVRRQAVKAERNTTLLQKVVENDSSKDVRDAARARLKELKG